MTASPISPVVRADDVMFHEVLALLADWSSLEEEPLPQPRHAVGSVARRKRELDKLRQEEIQLTQQLVQLRFRFGLNPFASAREEVLKQRRKREEAERENEALRSALEEYTVLLRGLRDIYGEGPRLDLIQNIPARNSSLDSNEECCNRLDNRMPYKRISCMALNTPTHALWLFQHGNFIFRQAYYNQGLSST